MRMEPWTAAWGRPVASKTCDGARDFELQAEPVETSMPFSSKWRRSASPSMSRNRIFALFGRRKVGWPFRYVRGIDFVIP